MSAIKLENWSLGIDTANPFMAPELRGHVLRGDVATHPRLTGGRIQTSPIVATEGRLVRVSSGSVYELGAPDPDYVDWLRKRGKSIDEKEPVKISDRPPVGRSDGEAAQAGSRSDEKGHE